MSAAGEAGFMGVVVLAGSRSTGDPMARAHGLPHKALLPVLGVPMLERVLTTLEACPSLGRIAVVTGEAGPLRALPSAARLADAGRLAFVAQAASPSRSVQAGLEAIGGLPALVTTADHPLLTVDLVELFLARAREGGGDLAVGITPETVIAAAFPESRRTYWRFRDGGVSGANLFAALRPGAGRVLEFWRRAEENRKRPWRMVLAFGPLSVLLYLTGRLSLAEAFERASRLIGARVTPVVLDIAEAAVDVDKPEDLDLVERILAARPAA
jgi:CTP:molybdopterin cytidylyltransferase MocA